MSVDGRARLGREGLWTVAYELVAQVSYVVRYGFVGKNRPVSSSRVFAEPFVRCGLTYPY